MDKRKVRRLSRGQKAVSVWLLFMAVAVLIFEVLMALKIVLDNFTVFF